MAGTAEVGFLELAGPRDPRPPAQRHLLVSPPPPSSANVALLPKAVDPALVFDRLFGAVSSHEWSRMKSILDFVREDSYDLLVAGKCGAELTQGRHIRYPNSTPLNNLGLSLLGRMSVSVRKTR